MNAIEKLFILIGLALIVAACTPSQLAVATRTANGVAEFAEATHDVLAKRYKAEQVQCVELAPARADAEFCVQDVRKRYEPAWRWYNNLRRAWLLLSSAIQSAKIVNDAEDPRLLPAISKLLKAREGFDQVADVLKEDL